MKGFMMIVPEMEDLTINANTVKEGVIQRLLTDGVLTNEQAREYIEKWQVVVTPRKWYQRWAKAFAKDGKDNSTYFKYLKFED